MQNKYPYRISSFYGRRIRHSRRLNNSSKPFLSIYGFSQSVFSLRESIHMARCSRKKIIAFLDVKLFFVRQKPVFIDMKLFFLCSRNLFLLTWNIFLCNMNFFLNIKFFSATPNFCFRLLKLLCHGDIFLLLHNIKNITTCQKKKFIFVLHKKINIVFLYITNFTYSLFIIAHWQHLDRLRGRPRNNETFHLFMFTHLLQ